MTCDSRDCTCGNLFCILLFTQPWNGCVSYAFTCQTFEAILAVRCCPCVLHGMLNNQRVCKRQRFNRLHISTVHYGASATFPWSHRMIIRIKTTFRAAEQVSQSSGTRASGHGEAPWQGGVWEPTAQIRRLLFPYEIPSEPAVSRGNHLLSAQQYVSMPPPAPSSPLRSK